MTRFFYICLLGIIGAAVAHLCILLIIPQLSVHDAWTRMSSAFAPYNTVQLDNKNSSLGLPTLHNPYTNEAACLFNLESGMTHIHSSGQVPLWSFSLFDSRGINTFSITDSSTTDGILDIIILTPLQLIEMKDLLSDEFNSSIIVETDLTEGFILARIFNPDQSWQSTVNDFIGSINCEPIELISVTEQQ